MKPSAISSQLLLRTTVPTLVTSAERARSGRQTSGGFSLVEFIVSLQLFGVLALTTAPMVPKVLQAYKLRGAARNVFAELQKARMAAVAQNHRYRFVVVDSRTYKVHSDTNNNGAEDPGEIVMTRDIQIDAPGVRFTDDAKSITFAANGAAPGSGTVAVRNQTKPGMKLNVVVRPAGRVQISQADHD